MFPALIVVTNDPELIKFFDQFVDEDMDFSEDEYDDWYCIQIKPFKCVGCGDLICYCVAGPHHILIWPERDDETILGVADLLMKDGDYDPLIVRYNRIFGPCVPYEKALELGWQGEITHG